MRQCIQLNATNLRAISRPLFLWADAPTQNLWTTLCSTISAEKFGCFFYTTFWREHDVGHTMKITLHSVFLQLIHQHRLLNIADSTPPKRCWHFFRSAFSRTDFKYLAVGLNDLLITTDYSANWRLIFKHSIIPVMEILCQNAKEKLAHDRHFISLIKETT